jgi:hypothetical protein
MEDEIDRSHGHRNPTIDPGRDGRADLSERTDLPVTDYPRLETRQLPFTERLRLLWLRQIPRSSARRRSA